MIQVVKSIEKKGRKRMVTDLKKWLYYQTDSVEPECNVKDGSHRMIVRRQGRLTYT